MAMDMKLASMMVATIFAFAALSAFASAAPAAEDSSVSFLFQVVGLGAEYAAGSDGDDDVHDGVLTLTGVPDTTMAFSDRPAEIDGHIPTFLFVATFAPISGPGDNSFYADPPAAAFSCVSDDGDIKRIVFQLMRPTIGDSTVTFDVNVLYVEGETDDLLKCFSCPGLSTLVVDSLGTYHPVTQDSDGYFYTEEGDADGGPKRPVGTTEAMLGTTEDGHFTSEGGIYNAPLTNHIGVQKYFVRDGDTYTEDGLYLATTPTLLAADAEDGLIVGPESADGWIAVDGDTGNVETVIPVVNVG